MINVTELLCGTLQPADSVHSGEDVPTAEISSQIKPTVVWNITRRCNLRCEHCYADAAAKHYPGELTLQQLIDVVDDLVDYRVPAILLSGGEPTLHPHFYDLAGYAVARGLRVTVSTNGTRIDSHAAERLKDLGVSYVEISLDGIGEVHDHFRGKPGTFQKALDAFRHCRGAGQKSGLRVALARQTISQLPEILRFIEEEDVPRVCFYHLAPGGRGADLDLLPAAETRNALRMITDAVLRWNRQGNAREIFTSDQPVDGAFFWLTMRRRDPERAGKIWELLTSGEGRRSTAGFGISNIDSQGNVHPDEFWQHQALGNVKDRPFSEICETGLRDDFLMNLRDRTPLLQGRCSECRFKELCGGGFRARAFLKCSDPWAEDPGCYLRDYEIAGV